MGKVTEIHPVYFAVRFDVEKPIGDRKVSRDIRSTCIRPNSWKLGRERFVGTRGNQVSTSPRSSSRWPEATENHDDDIVPREVPETLLGSRWCWLEWPARGCRTWHPAVSSAASVLPLRCSVSKIRKKRPVSAGWLENERQGGERCYCAKREELRPTSNNTHPAMTHNTRDYQLASINNSLQD